MSDKRACISKSFGLKDIVFCSCNNEEVKQCKQKYETYKKENYIDAKRQKSFSKKGKTS